jgi:cytoskeleton protein RodZ
MGMSGNDEQNGALFPDRVGDRLRNARQKAGLDLSDIAARTRVPLRHLTAIESGDYSSLPSSTYSIGFVRAYARAVGEDEAGLARDLREELGTSTPLERSQPIGLEEVEARAVPPMRWVWIALLVAAIIGGGYALIRAFNATPTETAVPEAATEDTGEAAPEVGNETAAPAVVSPKGSVLLIAKDAVWLRIYDANDKVLFEKEMARGETFAVPADANNPMVRTGRADLISVTVDGKEVAPLGPPERTIKDVGISAAALSARAAAPEATVAGPGTMSPSAASGAAAAAPPVQP